MRPRTAPFIAAFVVAGFAFRLAFGFGYWIGKPLMKDEQEYLLLATRTALGQGFSFPAPPDSGPEPRRFERPPAFAFFLSTVLVLTRDSLLARPDAGTDAALPPTSTQVPASIKVAQSFLGAIGIVLIAALARRAAGDRAALIAAALSAVYPPLVWISAYVLSEPLYTALALAVAWLLQKAADDSGRAQALMGLAAGVLAGVALLTKEAIIFFLPMAALWLAWQRKLTLVVVAAIGVACVVFPWIARNYVVHGKFVLTASHGGVTLWTGNNPLAHGEGDLAANPAMGMARVSLENSYPGYTNQQLDDVYYREVFEFVRQHPWRWLTLELRKLFYTFVPIGPSYRLHSPRYYIASLVSYGMVMPFALAGLLWLRQRRQLFTLWGLWLMALSTIAVSLVFFPQERFRIPVIDPAAIVAAGAFAASRRV